MAKTPNLTTSGEVVTIDIRPFVMPISLIICTAIIGASLIISANIVSGRPSVAGTTTVASSASSTDTGTVTPTTATVKLDDDAVLGDKNSAKVAIVEFSDYECPFCKQFRDQTFDQIKTNYIDNGKAILVYRDLPLSFHEPSAGFAANAMECVRKQGGDSAYYKAHDFWFATTGTNGKGIGDNKKLSDFVNSIGLNGQAAVDCASKAEFAAEITTDTSDAAAIGITGTPGFVVGKINGDGTVTGDVISGAYPYASFQASLDKYMQ